jgi:hypothetical protein
MARIFGFISIQWVHENQPRTFQRGRFIKLESTLTDLY